jgi:antitoxin component YwqK of YwqJK toxin-antitoxin module
MKFAIVLVVSILLIPTMLPSQEKVKGGFRECRVYEYEYKGGLIDTMSRRLSKVLKFYDNGKKIECELYRFNGIIATKNHNIYNDDGKLIEHFSFYFNDSTSVKIINKYDKNGNLTEEATYNTDDSLDEIVTHQFINKDTTIEWADYKNGNLFNHGIYKFDENDSLIESIVYNSDNLVLYKTTYNYLTKENIIEQREYKFNGVFQSLSISRFDKTGYKIEFKRINSDSTFNKKLTYKYNKKGKLLEEASFYPDGSLESKTKYNDRGSIIELLGYKTDGTVNYKQSNKFDKRGNLIKDLYNSNGIDERSKVLKYDKYGNKIEIIIYYKNLPVSKTEYIYSK